MSKTVSPLMIVFVISHDNCYTIKRFLKSWGRPLQGRVRLIFYDDLAHRKSLPRAVYIFTDLERLLPPQKELAAEAARQLKAAGMRVLNDPRRVLGRYDLLRALHAEGINRFSAYRLADDLSALRFPAFLRFEREHQGSLSPLLNDHQELERAIENATRAGLRPEDLLIVEFCPTADAEGVYQKRATFLIGERFASRQLLYSREWVTKHMGVPVTDEIRAAKIAFAAEPHPHEKPLRLVFQRAGIDYGRIDYGLLDDNVQVWEINTNPSIVPERPIPPERRAELLPMQQAAAKRICAAFETLLADAANAGSHDAGSTPRSGRAIPFHVPRDLRKRLGVRPRDRRLHPLRRAARPFKAERIKRFLKRKIARSTH